MLLSNKVRPQTWIIFTVLVCFFVINEAVAYNKPFMRYRRAANPDPAGSSDVSASEAKGKEISKEKPKAQNSDKSSSPEDNEDSGREKLYSTRGLRPGDYEPEDENPRIHNKFEKPSNDEDVDVDD